MAHIDIKMGLDKYKQSLLLFTNASEDVKTKSEATEVVLHNKTYIVCQNKQNSRKPLYSGHLQTTDAGRSSQANRFIEVLPQFVVNLNADANNIKLGTYV